MDAALQLADVIAQFRNPPDLEAELRDLLAQVPAGRVSTYGALADALGDRAAARWVGHFMLHHDHSGQCPCHRVVRADGSLGLYVDQTDGAQAALLAREGVELNAGHVDVGRYGIERFRGPRPLVALRELQRSLRDEVRLDDVTTRPDVVGGVDVSYTGDEGVAAYALVDAASAELLWSVTVRRPVRFPYIPTYLAFRELPLHLDLLDEVRRAGQLAPIVLVDGTGILHPIGMGIATTLGVVGDVPTIGVAKKLLCGDVGDEDLPDTTMRQRIVELAGVPTATAIWTSPRSRRPIYVSPGTGVSVSTATDIARRLVHNRRLPEPLYWADRLSRQATREARGT